MSKRLDLVIFGATGFTGEHCIPYVHKLSKEHGRYLTWGVAGRSQEKLKESLRKVGKDIGDDLQLIRTIIADVKDYDSLVEMAKQAKVILNCCGPYRYFGYDVVKACIEAGTHHIDISGEAEFMERIQLDLHEAAKEKGIYVVSACGFDSIPTDLGVVFLEQKFEGTLNSVVTYLEGWAEEGTPSGSALNYGTWSTVVARVGNTDELMEIRKKLFTKTLPKFEPLLNIKNLPHKSKVVDGWVVPFPGADRAVVQRTQNYLYEFENKRPVQIGTYFVLKSFWQVLSLIIYGTLFSLLARFSFGKKLLLAYPSFFSGGLFNKDPPSEEIIEKSWFSVTLYGEGWREKLPNKDDQYAEPMDQYIVGKVKGKNPGYGATCVALVLAGIVILTETDKMAGKGKGGVYPPGAAFANTSIIKQLDENGVTFEIIEQKDITKSKM